MRTRLAGSSIVWEGARGYVLCQNRIGFYIVWWPLTKTFSAVEQQIVDFCYEYPQEGLDKEW